MIVTLVCCVGSVLLIFASATSFQSPPVLSQAELQELVKSAGAHIDEYYAALKDLTAEETRTIQTYDKNGKLICEQRTVSDFVLYQSQRAPEQVVEYRDMSEVGGKPVKDREKRLEKLFGRVVKAESSGKTEQIRKELDRINREGTRYSCGLTLSGQVLFKALVLHKDLRPVMSYEATGRERINDREVIVVQYLQTGTSPKFNINLSVPSELQGSKIFLRGRLWLDAQTAQLWREDREYLTRSPLAAEPLIVTRLVSDYAPGAHGLWLPKKIVGQLFQHLKFDRDNRPELLLNIRDVSEYGPFRRFGIAVKEGNVSPR